MPAHSKIQDEAEAVKWLREGKTYQWIVDEYLRKYHIETSVSLWAGLRRKHGIPRRITRDSSLIPWKLEPKHRYLHAAGMLRAEARRRAGEPLTPKTEKILNGWLRGLERDDVVVHYEPSTDQGFWYVAREDGDEDLIRRPEKATGREAMD